VVGKRTQETDIFKILQKIFKSTYSGVYSEAMLLDESPEDVIFWVEENLPLEYSGGDLVRGYEILSRADIFLGRVRRRQYYRLWKYATYLMTAGVQQMKTEKKSGFTRYRRPESWQMFVKARGRRELLKKILSKIARYSHLSSSKANLEMLPYLRFFLSRLDIHEAARIAAFYDLTQEELEFLVGEKRAKEIVRVVDEFGLHRVEDETFLASFEKMESVSKVRETEDVEEEIEEESKFEEEQEINKRSRKTKAKKSRDMTLDAFFGEE
jgi:replication factor C large subunit